MRASDVRPELMSTLRRAAELELVDEAALPELDFEEPDPLVPVEEAAEPEAEPVALAAPRSSV